MSPEGFHPRSFFLKSHLLVTIICLALDLMCLQITFENFPNTNTKSPLERYTDQLFLACRFHLHNEGRNQRGPELSLWQGPLGHIKKKRPAKHGVPVLVPDRSPETTQFHHTRSLQKTALSSETTLADSVPQTYHTVTRLHAHRAGTSSMASNRLHITQLHGTEPGSEPLVTGPRPALSRGFTLGEASSCPLHLHITRVPDQKPESGLPQLASATKGGPLPREPPTRNTDFTAETKGTFGKKKKKIAGS